MDSEKLERTLVPNVLSFSAEDARKLAFAHRLQIARAEIQKACKKGVHECDLDFQLDDAHCRTLEAEGYTVQVDDEDDTTISWE